MIRKLKARGFTLIELMIVVAIIGILAAIAIPNFIKYQLRSKRSEGSINVAGIRTAEISYQGTNDLYLATGRVPDSDSTASKRAWCVSGSCSAFDTLAWRPEGAVYFSYQVTSSDSPICFTAAAQGDIDGDGTKSCWVYQKLPTSGTAVGAGLGCTATKPDQTTMTTGEDVY